MSNQITRTELNKELRIYALEDMQIAQDNGQVAIAQTLRGLVTLKYANTPFACYEVLSSWGQPLTGLLSENDAIEFLMSIYDCSECDIIED